MGSVLSFAVLALLGPVTAETSEPGPSCRLRVHVASSGLTEEQLGLARLQVVRIWRPYGVSFEWPPAPPPPRPSGPGVLRVWLSRDGNPGEPPSGYVVFGGAAHPGDRIVVTAAAERLLATTRFRQKALADAARSLQDRVIAVALGRMLAHEIAHYVLASPAHAARGLLCGRLSTTDFLSEDLSRYRLDAAQVARLSSSAPGACLPPETSPLTTVASQDP